MSSEKGDFYVISMHVAVATLGGGCACQQAGRPCLCQAAARGGSVWARREREGTATLIRPRLPQGCRRKMAAVQSMRCDFGLRFSLRAILMLLSIEWTRGCMPRATQWRLEISQEYNSWEAYVYEFIAYEGTQGLNLTYSGDNCTRHWRKL